MFFLCIQFNNKNIFKFTISFSNFINNRDVRVAHNQVRQMK